MEQYPKITLQAFLSWMMEIITCTIASFSIETFRRMLKKELIKCNNILESSLVLLYGYYWRQKYMSKQNNEINDNEISKVVGGNFDPTKFIAGKGMTCPECKSEVPIPFILDADHIFCPHCGLCIYLHQTQYKK